MTDNAIECGLESRTGIRDEDEVLLSAAQTDTEAAGRLYDKYYREILGYLYHCTLDRAASEDVTSNVFLAVFRHLGRFRWKQIPFRAWLYRIATNEVRTYYRRQRRARATGLRPGNRVSGNQAPAAEEGPSDTEEYRLLHQALLGLRLKYRTVIILRYFEDKTIAEISHITGRKEGTIRCQLHRGLAQLQDLLANSGVLPE
jgi:RNA polymerase sigma-70 factor (ECF subfamily)